MQAFPENNETDCDADRFLRACEAMCGKERLRAGIGTLSEKTLHAVVKHYIEPDEALHEVKIGSSVADVCNAEGIFEIQTRAFDRLRPKLRAFLETEPVTVVYPLAAAKRLIWIDQETGETSKPRKSPKKGSYFDAFRELYKLDTLIHHEGLRILLLLIDMDEYRILNGWSADGKKGSTREERIPAKLTGALMLKSREDYARLLPQSLPEAFTSRALAEAAGLRLSTAQVTLTVLFKRGAISCIGRQGRMKLYKRIDG